ncbi:MAG: hypothetical protein H7X80_06545 [bacterium]|nr:hypothetical protein [Candidatus Kapabacteria bacterium]
MTRLILYIAIAFILWRIVRAFMNRAATPKHEIGGKGRNEQRIDPQRGPEIDYSKVRDADWREKP